MLPVVVLLKSFPLIRRRFLEVRLTRELSAERRVRRTVLDGSVTVSKVSEVVNVARREESTSSERVDRSITPLC